MTPNGFLMTSTTLIPLIRPAAGLLCLAVRAPGLPFRAVALTVGLALTQTSSVLAACPSATADMVSASHPFGTIRRAPDPVRYPADPDWLAILEDNAHRAVASGLWEARLRDSVAMLRDHAVEPRFPLRRPMARTAMLIEKPTGVDRTTRHAALPVGALSGFARTYLLFDETNGVQRRFARQIVSTVPTEAGLRPIVTFGSVARARDLLETRVWADQGSVLTRRLGLTHWPALVRLTPERITVWMPALNLEGEPIDPMPAVFSEHPAPSTQGGRHTPAVDAEVRS